MNRSKIQISWVLILLGCFIFPNSSFAQTETKEKKQIVIVKKTIDKDGNEVVERIIKEGKEAEDFDVAKYLKEDEHGAANVNVEVRVTKEGEEEPESEEREIEVTVTGDDVVIMEGDEKTIIKIDGDEEKKEITTEDGKQIIIIKSAGGESDAFEILEELDVEMDGDKKTEIRIMKTRKGNGAFFGVMIDPSAEGMELLDVVKDSPAEKAGLKKGDILQSVNEHQISTYEELTKVLSNYKPGDSIVVMYRRDGQINKVQANLANSKDVPMQEKMIWKTDDGKVIEMEEGHFEEEGTDGAKKIKKKIIIKKEKDN
ncbi:MAG: PDZ domain-containing protein [Saprospiraceae bacterium]